MSRATGVSRRAIRVGIAELKTPKRERLIGRVRKPGGGRKRTLDKDPKLLVDLEKLIEPTTRGDPETPLRWTCKSVRVMARELNRRGHKTSHRMVAELLHGSHFPPGTSKWNKIEHWPFSFISQNWRGKPLTSYRVIVSLIAATTTSTGLKVKAKLDTNDYPAALKVPPSQLDGLNMRPAHFHGGWNYTLLPGGR